MCCPHGGRASGAMLGPVGRLVLLRLDGEAQSGARHVGADHARPRGTGDRTAHRRLHHHLLLVAVDLPRTTTAAAGLMLVLRFVPDVDGGERRPLDWAALILTGLGQGSSTASRTWAGTPSGLGGGAHDGRGRGMPARLLAPPAHTSPDHRSWTAQDPDVLGRSTWAARLRMGMGATPFLPLLLQVLSA